MIENVKHRDSAQRGPFSVCPLTLSASAFRILNRASRSHGQHPGWIGETESRNEHSLQESTPWNEVGGKLDWFLLFEAKFGTNFRRSMACGSNKRNRFECSRRQRSVTDGHDSAWRGAINDEYRFSRNRPGNQQTVGPSLVQTRKKASTLYTLQISSFNLNWYTL